MARVRGTGSGEIDGLAELVRELKKLEDGDLANELKRTNQAVAQIVVDDATELALSLGSTAAHAVRAGGLKASKSMAAAAVVLGGVKAPEALGAEYGAKQYPQFSDWRGNDENAGYFLWPTIRADHDKVLDVYGDALKVLTAKAFPD